MLKMLLVVLALGATSKLHSGYNKKVKFDVIKDVIHIKSTNIIQSAYLSEQSEWCSYFVEYSPDGKEATILIRTKTHPLRLVVETTTVRGIALKEVHTINIDNPTRLIPE